MTTKKTTIKKTNRLEDPPPPPGSRVPFVNRWPPVGRRKTLNDDIVAGLEAREIIVSDAATIGVHALVAAHGFQGVMRVLVDGCSNAYMLDRDERLKRIADALSTAASIVAVKW